MIIKKKKQMFVVRQRGIAVVAVIAPTRKQAWETTEGFIGGQHGNSRQLSARR